MYQMKNQMEADCGFNVGIVGDGEWAPVKGFNVGMVQTFVAQLKVPSLDAERREVVRQLENRELTADNATIAKEAKRRYDRSVAIRNRALRFLELVEVVIGEEAHEAGGNSYYEILKHCKNAHIRVALTATPFMRDAAEDNMRLMAAFGPVLVRVSEKLLIDRGILAKPYFRFVESKPHPKLRKSSPWQRAYELGYATNEFMIADIVNDAKRAIACGLPVLTLIQRMNHGATLYRAMIDAGVRSVFLRGENDQDERERALKALAAGKIDNIIGSTIVDVGVDVPAIGLVQLAGGGKAEVALRQRVGRGLRAKKGMKNVCFIADYTVGPCEGGARRSYNSYLRDHARQRRGIIEGTPGFVEGILAPGADFPWHLFAERAAA
jgi:superfamily II DNA or RNA helicase